MIRKTMILLMLLYNLPLFCEETNVKGLFSLDLDYARIGLENNGWGVGVAYERIMIDHVSLDCGLGHMTFKTNIEDLYCTSVSLSLMSNYYFFSAYLNRIYCGIGMATDFLNYFSPGVLPEENEDTVTYLCTNLGWKYYLFPRFLLEFVIGYNYIISNAENYPTFSDYYGKAGLRYSLSFKFIRSK